MLDIKLYFIINISKPPHEVRITDLDLVLGPNKAMDLEKFRSRNDIDSSQDLKNLVKSRKVQLRQTVRSKPKTTEDSKPQDNSLNEKDIKRITESVVKELKQTSEQQNQNNATPPEMIELLKQIKEGMSQQQPDIVNHPPQFNKDEDEDLDLDRLSDIHAKSVSRSTRSSVGKVVYEEKTSKGRASSRADELEDLLN